MLTVHLNAAEKPAGALPRSTPEAQGIASTAILAFLDGAEQQVDSLHSVMLLRHGHVVAEGWWAPYNPRSPHELYSLSKSFTSTAVGFAVSEGRLSIDDTVLSFFPDDAPVDPGNQLRAMRVRDLLCMSTGHQTEPSAAPDVVSARSFLAQPVPFKPGTHFVYNTAATFMQSAIVQKVTGQTVLDYLRPRLFEPLGISNPTWQTNFQGISLGGYGLSVCTEDIARLGQFYLQKGRWHGKQLLPAAWIEMATARQVSNGSNPKSDWDQGYGFQFWRCRHGAYRGDGAFGQYCVVMPDQDAVLAITSGLGDMQAVLNLAWDHLLPAMKERKLRKNTEARSTLTRRLQNLTLRTVPGAATSPLLAQVSGKPFEYPANEQKIEKISLAGDSAGRQVTLTLRRDGVDQRIACGFQQWITGRAALGAAVDRPMAATGAWTAEDTFTARLCFYETPYVLTVTLRFAGHDLVYNAEANVGFGPTKQPQLTGRTSR